MRWGLVGVFAVAACFGPRLDYQNGELRCDDGSCPPGFECRPDGMCWRPGSMGAPPVDAPLVLGDGPQAVCSGSDRSCATPTQPRHCDQGAWVDDPPCDASAPVCDNGQCQSGCTPPAARCHDSRTPEACNASGYWDPQPMCPFACTGDGACTGECVPFERECRSGNELWECSRDGHWALKDSCPLVCENASCGGECSAGETRCSPTAPKVPETCGGGHWQDQAPCTYACLADGTCAPECAPGGPGTCIGGDAYSCDATGHWALAEHCTANCSAGACTGACMDGKTQCSGAGNRTPQTCTGGAWVDGSPCEYVCDQGSCVVTECHPNVDKKCQDGFPYSCDATGHFVKGSACTFVCDGDQCGGVCRPGSFRCNGTTNLERCADDGKSWALDHACPFGCANDQCNACVPEPMATTCQGKCGTVDNNCGMPVSCGDSCAATHGASWSCSAATHTCTCARDVTGDCSGKCGTISDRCGFSVDCSAAGNGGLACNAAGQVCRGDHTCCAQEPIGTTCSGDPGDDCNAMVANNCGVQVSCPSTCDGGFSCGGNPATPQKCSCPPGAVRCVGSVSQTCSGGLSWGGDMSCEVACIDGVGCGVCTSGQTQCADATHIQSCGATGMFGAPTACPASTPACRPSTQTCGGVCVPGSQKCGTDPGGAPAVLGCDAEGQYSIVVQTCAFTCAGGTTSPACGGECHPGDTQCSGDSLLTCGADFTYAGGTMTACGASNHCGVAGGVASCCTETDADMCPGTGGAVCNNATVTKACGYQLTCAPSSCQGGLSCGGNPATPTVCSCSPNSKLCQGSALLVCNATGTAVATTGCASGCDQGACCLSDSAYCVSTHFCDGGGHAYCGRTVFCSETSIDNCMTRFGSAFRCDTFVAGKCADCVPNSSQPCNEGSCDSQGIFHPGSGCGSNCCCNQGGSQTCLPRTTCTHSGGSC